MSDTPLSSKTWVIAPGDPTHVFAPDLAKPINCHSRERAAAIVAAMNGQSVEPTAPLAERIIDVIKTEPFELWAIGQGGYDLTREERLFGRTYQHDRTEYAWRGWACGRSNLVQRAAETKNDASALPPWQSMNGGCAIVANGLDKKVSLSFESMDDYNAMCAMLDCREAVETNESLCAVCKQPMSQHCGTAAPNAIAWCPSETVDAQCGCYDCSSIQRRMSTMIVCPECGNKRCPRSTSHMNACTNSNESGQPGSRY